MRAVVVGRGLRQPLNSLGETAKKKADELAFVGFSCMARPEGFEPPTPKFVAWCSIQLSYGRRVKERNCAGIAREGQRPDAHPTPNAFRTGV